MLVVLAATRVAGSLTRPEVIVPDEAALADEARTSAAALVSGASVRLVSQTDLGTSATVVREPRREAFGVGRQIDVVDVELARGGRRLVPVADVEVISSGRKGSGCRPSLVGGRRPANPRCVLGRRPIARILRSR